MNDPNAKSGHATNRPTRRHCSECGTETTVAKRFCHLCGTPIHSTTAQPKSNSTTAMNPKWIAMGVGVALLAAFGVSTWTTRTTTPESIPTLSADVTPTPPDLSSMSPEEQAIRLYDRIMSASAQNLPDEAVFFRPMALQAYDNLAPLTNKFRFHVAMIHAVTGDLASADAHADTLGRAAPNYLLGFVVRHRIAELKGDLSAANEAVEGFQRAFASESTTSNPDYAAHAPLLQQFLNINLPR